MALKGSCGERCHICGRRRVRFRSGAGGGWNVQAGAGHRAVYGQRGRGCQEIGQGAPSGPRARPVHWWKRDPGGP
eukprot:10964257-Lingulodinium_polyedra.AAC.1